MDGTLMILFFLFDLLSVGTGNPLPEDKHSIELEINTLMIRLNALPYLLQTLPGSTFTPPVELQQFTSIAAALDGYNNLISENLLDVFQVKTDISTLTNTTIQKFTNCTTQNPELIIPRRLQHLQNVWEQNPESNVEAISLEALHGVKGDHQAAPGQI